MGKFKGKILEINLDNNLSFYDHDSTLCKTAGNKLTFYTWYIYLFLLLFKRFCNLYILF